MKHLARELNELLDNKFVLVVEPKANYRTSIKQFLFNLKVKSVRICSTIAEAKREMLTVKIGLFIVEWNLPEQNGLHFCRELRKEKGNANIPFLLLSVENLKKDVILASEVGINGYLLKPFSYEDFCMQLQYIIEAKAHPNLVTGLLDLGDVELEKQNYGEAIEHYQHARQMAPNSARAVCGLAKIAHLTGHNDQAVKFLHEAIDINPDYIALYREMIKIYQASNDLGNLIKASTAIHILSPDNPRYTLILAAAYLEMGNLEKSQEFFSLTVRLSPTLAEGYKGLGTVQMEKKEYEKAMKNFQKALDLDQEDISTLNSLGLSFVKQGMPKEGLKHFMMALRIDPHHSKVHFNIGHTYEKMGFADKAKTFYNKALIYDNQFEKAKRGLGRVEKGSDKDDLGAENEDLLKISVNDAGSEALPTTKVDDTLLEESNESNETEELKSSKDEASFKKKAS